MPLMLLENIGKVYPGGGGTVALKGVSLSVEDGEHLAIMGPSGSGKSTLMHIIGLLDRPTSGRYILDGREVEGLSDDKLAEVRNMRIGFVFQSFHLLPRATAVENVMLPFTYSACRPKDARELAMHSLEMVGMGHRLDHRPNQLSGGECQRVAIARALVTQPAIILADEPTGNLDAESTESVLRLLDRLNLAGKTIIVVTHDAEVGGRCPRLVTLSYGDVIEDRRSPAPRPPDRA